MTVAAAVDGNLAGGIEGAGFTQRIYTRRLDTVGDLVKAAYIVKPGAFP